MSQDPRHSEQFKTFCDQSGVEYTDHNFKTMRKYVIDKYKMNPSLDTIIPADHYAAVYFDLTADGTPLRNFVTHVPPPIPAAPIDRRSDFNKLADAGIRKSPGLYSHSERAKDEAEKKAEQARILEEIRQSVEQAERRAQIAQAKNIYVQGPFGINYAATERARKEALDKLNATPEERA